MNIVPGHCTQLEKVVIKAVETLTSGELMTMTDEEVAEWLWAKKKIHVKPFHVAFMRMSPKGGHIEEAIVYKRLASQVDGLRESIRKKVSRLSIDASRKMGKAVGTAVERMDALEDDIIRVLQRLMYMSDALKNAEKKLIRSYANRLSVRREEGGMWYVEDDEGEGSARTDS
jgi:hypothetical protein